MKIAGGVEALWNKAKGNPEEFGKLYKNFRDESRAKFKVAEETNPRSDVQSTVMNSLRAILGAAFTEKEGERVIRNTWNEADTTANNISRLNRLVENLKAQADDKDQKVGFYEQNSGSLSGFQAGPSKAPMNDQNIAHFATQNGITYEQAASTLKARGYGR